MSEILPFSLSLSFRVIVARKDHTSVVLSDGSVLVMGGSVSFNSKSDVWKTVDGGASWILVTSSAGWGGKNILHLSNSLHILPSLGEDACRRHLHCYSVSRVFHRCEESTLP